MTGAILMAVAIVSVRGFFLATKADKQWICYRAPVRVAVIAAIAHGTAMGMAMIGATMRVAMVGTAVLESEDANEIDDEAKEGDHEEALVFYFRRLRGPLDGLREDEEGDEKKKETIHEAGYHLGAHVTVRLVVMVM